MKKLVLLGDSIRLIGYGARVAELLGDEYTTWQPEDNCRWADYTYRMLSDKAEEIKDADIIHWNNGHWDICDLFGIGPFTSEEEFVTNMMQILDILQKRHKVIIFSTTTPVRYANKYNKNEVIERYNDLIVPKLRERGVIINDLNSLLKPDIDRYICDDNIHLTEEGIELCASRVANCIKEAARMLEGTGGSKAAEGGYELDSGAPVLI